MGFAFIAGALLLGCMIFLFLPYHQRQEIIWLKKHGEQVSAVIVKIKKGTEIVPEHMEVQVEGSFRSANVSSWSQYYTVLADWTDPETHKVHRFTSDRLEMLPSHWKEGGTIAVRIDRQKPYRYYLETNA